MEILGQSTKATTQHPYMHLGYLAASNRDVFMIPLIPGLLLLVFGSLQLYFRKKRYFKASIASIIGGLIFLTMAISFFFDKPNIPSRILTSINYHALHISLSSFAKENDNNLPDSKHWCDLLISGTYAEPKYFTLSGVKEGESAYALNENVLNLTLSEIPADMVLLFETNLGIEEERTGSFLSRDYVKSLGIEKDHKIFQNRWNQVGGAEDITTEYHKGEGACVLFAGGHCEFVKTGDIATLKWHPGESEMPLEISQ